MTELDAASSGLAVRAGDAFAAYRSGHAVEMDRLVDLLTPILWHTARAQGLDSASAQDVVQSAWLRLVEKADTIADPRAVLGWLIVTTRRESWRVAKEGSRLTGEPDAGLADPTPEPGVLAADHEADSLLWRHVQSLSPTCQALLRVIAFAERPDYATISQSLGMPVGSIGPTRGRCLAKLRAALAGDPRWAGVS